MDLYEIFAFLLFFRMHMKKTTVNYRNIKIFRDFNIQSGSKVQTNFDYKPHDSLLVFQSRIAQTYSIDKVINEKYIIQGCSSLLYI